MKILLDHNLDRRLKSYLSEHTILTTYQQGWTDVVNGKLLDLAEENGFDILLTADASIKKQQNMAKRKIAIVVLRAFNNRLATHVQMIEEVGEALSKIRIGEIMEVFHNDIVGKLRD